MLPERHSVRENGPETSDRFFLLLSWQKESGPGEKQKISGCRFSESGHPASGMQDLSGRCRRPEHGCPLPESDLFSMENGQPFRLIPSAPRQVVCSCAEFRRSGEVLLRMKHQKRAHRKKRNLSGCFLGNPEGRRMVRKAVRDSYAEFPG